MQKAVEQATGKQISEASRELEDFVRQNEGKPEEISQQQSGQAPLQGYKMEVERRDTTPNTTSSSDSVK